MFYIAACLFLRLFDKQGIACRRRKQQDCCKQKLHQLISDLKLYRIITANDTASNKTKEMLKVKHLILSIIASNYIFRSLCKSGAARSAVSDRPSLFRAFAK